MVEKPAFRHRLEHALFLAVAWKVRWLPERAALALGAALGWVAGSLLRIRRSVVEENLARAFPHRPSDWRRAVAGACYRHLGREAVSLLRLEGMSPEEIRQRCEVVGMDGVREALARGHGVILLTGHLGNWEVGGAVVAANGIPLDVVARKQANPLFEARLRRTRERVGMRVVYRQEATRRLLRSLREPRAAALVADQNVRSGGIFVDFFGHPAATARGPALLAARTGAEVHTVMVHRIPGPRARYRLTVAPLAGTVGATEEAQAILLRGYHAVLEAAIEAAPDQYFWFHRRWKTRPGGSEPAVAEEVRERPTQGRGGSSASAASGGSH